MKKTLPQIRKDIDAIDLKLIHLLARRNRLSRQVGEIKRASGKAVFAPEREEALLKRLEGEGGNDLSSKAIRAIFREILSASRFQQKQLHIAYLGPEATHCHQAALQRFGSSDSFKPCQTIPEIFQLIEHQEADAGVVPIENSLEGGVSAAMDALTHSDLVICGEIYQDIAHALMASRKTKQIEKIYSHPQAFGQCRQWLYRHFPGIPCIEVSSTSEGALRCKSETGAGAVAGEFAADFHHLKIWHRRIQDVEKNMTRFLMIGREMPEPSGQDKTSLLFAVSHQVGALNRILELFARHELNLNKIESRPVPHKPWEYVFFVDVHGHSKQNPLKSALREIKQNTLWLKVLGSYPRVQIND